MEAREGATENVREHHSPTAAMLRSVCKSGVQCVGPTKGREREKQTDRKNEKKREGGERDRPRGKQHYSLLWGPETIPLVSGSNHITGNV